MLKERIALGAAPAPLVPLALLGLLSACSVVHPPPSFPGQPAPQEEVTPPEAQQPGAAAQTPSLPVAPSTAEQHAPQRQFHLSQASSALVAQSRSQASGGNFVAANATLERAQRIEPNNPLVWIEMGQVQLQEGNAVQAGNTGKKALQLASGDPVAKAQAWRLIADSYRAQGKDADAAEAEHQADGLAAR